MVNSAELCKKLWIAIPASFRQTGLMQRFKNKVKKLVGAETPLMADDVMLSTISEPNSEIQTETSNRESKGYTNDETDRQNERTIEVQVGDKAYFIVSDDQYLDHIQNGFEPEMVSLFSCLAQNSRVILDIGANIGCTSLLFSELAEKVFAFEPSPTTCGFLKRNIRASQKDNIYVKNFGLGVNTGEFTLTHAASDRSGGFVSNLTQASVGHVVEKILIRTLDGVVEDESLDSIDFIKIDVEGFEGQVLEGGLETLRKNKPVVVLELNHWCLNALQRTSVPDFFDKLRSIFPLLYAVHGNDYLNLYDDSEAYGVMYQHIIGMKFQNIVAAYSEDQLAAFKSQYFHGFTG